MAEVSLSDFVNAQREKKRREALAQQFLGSQARRGSAPGAGVVNARAKDQKPTLLSRMSGVQKRSSSAKPTTNIDGKWQHDLHRVNNPNGPASKKLNRTVSTPHLPRNARTEDQFVAIFNGNAQSARTNNAGPKFNGGAGFSIKGSASRGPYTIIASNFAPGTTGSDIEEVMAPHGMGTFLAARVIMPGPTVMAEIDFDSKDGADNVIQVFNNQKADGKVLYVYHKNASASGPGLGPSTASLHTRPTNRAMPPSFDNMDVDTNASTRTTGGSFQDGRFGFNSLARIPPRGPRRRF